MPVGDVELDRFDAADLAAFDFEGFASRCRSGFVLLARFPCRRAILKKSDICLTLA